VDHRWGCHRVLGRLGGLPSAGRFTVCHLARILQALTCCALRPANPETPDPTPPRPKTTPLAPPALPPATRQPRHTRTMAAISHSSSVGVVFPITAPNAIMADAAQNAASMIRGRSRRMELRPSCQKWWMAPRTRTAAGGCGWGWGLEMTHTSHQR